MNQKHNNNSHNNNNHNQNKLNRKLNIQMKRLIIAKLKHTSSLKKGGSPELKNN